MVEASCTKSVLLNTRMSRFPSQRGSIWVVSCGICETAFVASTIQSTISACSNFWKVRSIPRFSMVSFVSRMPAVSINRKVIPPRLTVSSITSRVVPCMSLTMARSSFSSAFNRVDLPAFVSPMMATGTPFLMALPTLKDCTKREITCSMPSARRHSSERSANSSSSWSLKSSSSSMSDVKCSNWSRSEASSLLNPPRIWLMARR